MPSSRPPTYPDPREPAVHHEVTITPRMPAGPTGPDYLTEASGEPSPPFGPAEIEIGVPGGTFDQHYFIRELPTNWRTWLDEVDESRVICFQCEHAWLIWKHAPVKNVKPDGTPFVAREGYCLLPAQYPGAAPLPLEERYVLKCNRFRPRADADPALGTQAGAPVPHHHRGTP